MSSNITDTIVKSTASLDDLDFEFLKKQGISYIEALGGGLWTDYNAHDPGITILEALCYAITDLGARINLPLEKLLAEKDNPSFLSDQFLTADKALPIKPVTANDYRKLFIDLPGIKNAWLKRHCKTVYVNCKADTLAYQPFEIETNKQKEFNLNGLYDILIELDAQAEIDLETAKIAVRETYHTHRNLCEDLVDIEEVKPFPIAVCAQIEVLPEADEEKVHALVLQAIENYLSPEIRFYSLKDMLNKGYSTDVIFNGPLLKNGFIDTQELQATTLTKEVRLTDLIKIIQAIEGVDVIRDITINNCTGKKLENAGWNICITDNRKPVLCTKSSFSYFKGFLPLNIDKEKVAIYREEQAEDIKNDIDFIASQSKTLDLPKGDYLDTGSYTTIQNDFPDVYAIGQTGSKANATVAEKAKAKQLKAYLLFFDQILATYMAHIEKVKDLFSIQGQLSTTYFTQLVEDIKNRDELVSNNYNTDEALSTLLFTTNTKLDDSTKRRNQILDHLLARFAENFSEYAFLMKQLYSSNKDKEVIKTKERFLQSYETIGCERPLSFNYYRQNPENLWNTNNVSAFQKRIALLTGNPDFSRRNFSDDPLELYEEIDTDGRIEYRFRIKSNSKVILTSSSKHYHTLTTLYAEILNVKNYGRFEKHYEIKTNKSGRFYFNLTNPNYPDSNDERHVIARRIPSFKTKASAENAIAATASFINTLKPNEGMYVIEHILLRPNVLENSETNHFFPICTNNCDACESLDPYSFRVSIVLPGWTERYSNVDFRRYIENLIQNELPAHILAKICWIGYPASYDTKDKQNEMIELEEAYKNWLFEKTKLEQDQPIDEMIRLKTIVNTLHTIYTQGRLHNCDSDEEQQDIILGRTNLGKL